MTKKQAKKRKLLSFVLVLAVILVIIVVLRLIPKLSPQELRDYFQAKGSAAAYYYILAFTLLPACFFPVTPFAIASGLVFTFGHGLLYTLIGAFFNSTLTFWLARKLASERFQAFIRKHDTRGWVETYLHSGQTNSFYLLLLLRLIPLVPFTLLNYASGLGQIPYALYLLATLLGMLPGTMVMVNLGDKVLELGSPSFYLSLVLMVVLVVVGILAAKRVAPDLDREFLRDKLKGKEGTARKKDSQEASDNSDTFDRK